MLLAAVPVALTLSLPRALTLADHAAQVAVAQHEAEAQAQRARIARAPANPTIAVGTTRYSGKETVAISEELRWAGQRKYAVQAAEEVAAGARAAWTLALAAARRDIRRGWFELANAEDGERLADEVRARAHDLTAAVGARLEAGKVARLDWVRAQAEEARLAARLAAARQEHWTAWLHLALLVGLDPSTEGSTDGSRPVALDEAALQCMASPTSTDPIENHPAVVEARAERDAAHAARELEVRRRLPGLGLELGMTAGDPGLPGTDRQAILSLTVPLGSPGPLAVRQADAELAAAEARLDRARRAQREALETALHQALGARAQYVAYEATALPAAEEAARLTREAYQAGRGDLVRVLDAERNLLEVRAARFEAYLGLQEAEAELRLAGGVEDDTR